MRFDASPSSMLTLSKQLKDDPRVVRWGTLKLGDALASTASTPRSTVNVEDWSLAFDAAVSARSSSGYSEQMKVSLKELDSGFKKEGDEVLALTRESMYYKSKGRNSSSSSSFEGGDAHGRP